MGKVAVIGMVGNSAFLSVDQFHRAGETVAATGIHFEPGGKGFNQAVAAARFGAQVSFLGAVGAQCREQIEEFLQNDGITPVLAQKDGDTAYAAILTDSTGANRVTVYQGVRLEPSDVERFAPFIREADVLLLNNEVPLGVNERALEIAKENDTYVIWNPAPSVDLPHKLIGMTDLFTPNEHETAGIEDAKDVIVTLGAQGCCLKATGEVIPAVRQQNVLDTTGAGDTFNGVLAAWLAKGESRRRSVLVAMAAAGLSVTRQYAATAIPYLRELLEESGK